MLSSFLIVGLGGALGAMLRYGAGVMVVVLGFGPSWVATLSVNLIGSFVMGLMASLLLVMPHLSEQLRLFIMVGLLGALATFSSFALDGYHLFKAHDWFLLGFYILGSILGAFISFAVGFWLAALLLKGAL